MYATVTAAYATVTAVYTTVTAVYATVTAVYATVNSVYATATSGCQGKLSCLKVLHVPLRLLQLRPLKNDFQKLSKNKRKYPRLKDSYNKSSSEQRSDKNTDISISAKISQT